MQGPLLHIDQKNVTLREYHLSASDFFLQCKHLFKGSLYISISGVLLQWNGGMEQWDGTPIANLNSPLSTVKGEEGSAQKRVMQLGGGVGWGGGGGGGGGGGRSASQYASHCYSLQFVPRKACTHFYREIFLLAVYSVTNARLAIGTYQNLCQICCSEVTTMMYMATS